VKKYLPLLLEKLIIRIFNFLSLTSKVLCNKRYLYLILSKSTLLGLIIMLCINVSGQKRVSKQKKSTQKEIQAKILYGQASYYSDKFNGRKTASGEIFSQKKLTAACNQLPFGTKVKVTNLKNGDSVVVTINDRLHPKTKRVVDLSKAAAKKIGLTTTGVTKVKVEVVE
jgi:rare lipoprotein A